MHLARFSQERQRWLVTELRDTQGGGLDPRLSESSFNLIHRNNLFDRGPLSAVAKGPGKCSKDPVITDGTSRTVDIEPFRLSCLAEGQRVEGRHPSQHRRDHVEPAVAG
jgi:hypothetical protein